MNWGEFKNSAPVLAAIGEERFDQSGIIMLGTLRKDGFPRISPVEPLILNGELYLGMIPESRKATDLLRDSRCIVHNTVSDRQGTEGEFKLYGRAVNVTDPGQRSAYAEALFQKIGWKPPEPYHLFTIDVLTAAFNQVKDGVLVSRRWTPESGDQVVRQWKPPE